MFEYDEEIEDKYLWNFTPAEQKRFRREHRQLQVDMDRYQARLYELMFKDSSAIFANYDPRPSSALAIKYTFNRLHANDPRETELCLNWNDPVASRNVSYPEQIVWALLANTNCRRIILNGVRSKDNWWSSRGLNNNEAFCLLDALSDKKLSELTISHYPLLTDEIYNKVADCLLDPSNQWAHVTLGKICCSETTKKRLEQTQKVKFSCIGIPHERE